MTTGQGSTPTFYVRLRCYAMITFAMAAMGFGMIHLLAAGTPKVFAAADTAAVTSDQHYVGCGEGIFLPRTVSIGHGVDATLVRSAMAEWNQTFGTVFVEAPTGGDVSIIADSVTWVEMPCASTKSVIHVGTDVDLNYWMAHELGHTLGLADHIRSFDDPSRYVNPGLCPNDGYVGIMSYCTPRQMWFGPQDVQMMDTLWPERDQSTPDAPVLTAISRPDFYAPDARSFDASLEQEMFTYLNGQRSASGLPALSLDPGLTAIARTRSQQLIDQGYFAHTDPYGYTMYVELLRDRGYSWQLAGENLAMNDWPAASSAQQAGDALMASPAHRENMLDATYTSVGIGEVTAANGAHYYAMVFLG